MQQHNEQERAEWVRLNVPLPPRLAELVGYRWVALHWDPCGDESFYDDGRMSGTGARWPHLTFVRHPAVAPELTAYNLGSAEGPASECLVLDRGEGTIYAAPVRSARRLLVTQHPPARPASGQVMGAETSLAEFLDLRTWREVHVSQADVERAMREEKQGIEEMVAFLNQYLK